MCPSPPRTIRYYSLYQTNVYFYSIFLCSPSFIPFSLNVDVLNMMLTCHVPLVRTAPGTSSHVIRLCSHTLLSRDLYRLVVCHLCRTHPEHNTTPTCRRRRRVLALKVGWTMPLWRRWMVMDWRCSGSGRCRRVPLIDHDENLRCST